ncbi:MAG TPA: hypothetical protein PK504_12410 [Ferruginibacter sp.]|nr:hypothetical protein [Ferruginibacter sp.]HRE62570.1 hypothetical protein [Ferruginibacter sp.]
MLTERQIQLLRSENEMLQLQLDDVNIMIQVREEELELLRKRAQEASELQSRVDANLIEFEQMQNHLGNCQQKNEGKDERLSEMEEELYASIKDQLKAEDKIKDFNSVQANLLDTSRELDEASAVYKKLQDTKKQLTSTKSELEIAHMEIDSLKQQLHEANALNEMLMKK